jgi:hypothetical protein
LIQAEPERCAGQARRLGMAGAHRPGASRARCRAPPARLPDRGLRIGATTTLVAALTLVTWWWATGGGVRDLTGCGWSATASPDTWTLARTELEQHKLLIVGRTPQSSDSDWRRIGNTYWVDLDALEATFPVTPPK